MQTAQRGFTLIELMIVLAIIGIIAAIAIPNLIAARLNANEAAAIATLRSIVTAQSQFQTGARADLNGNGVGEYGTFGEMSGAVAVRGGGRILTPSVLSTAFRTVNANGEVGRSGYLFAIWLPDAAGDGVAELAGGGANPTVDPDLGEIAWCCYAWPGNHGGSGNRTFFVNQGGDIITTENQAYSGPGNGPPANAAYSGAGSTITGIVASAMTGRDGNFWRQAK